MAYDTKSKLLKTIKGALIAGSGVALTYFLQSIGSLDFGAYSPMVAAMISILINTIKVNLKTEEKI